jgi:Flp pilus assembly protein TadD
VDWADAYAALGKWDELERFLGGQEWPGLETTRWALLARAKANGAEVRADSVAWQTAVRSASSSPEGLGRLATLTAAWGWRARTEETLWRAAEMFPDESWPLTRLDEFYLAKRDTAGLQRAARVALERNPEDGKAGNNYVTFSLLLDRDLERAHQLAAAVYSKSPTNAFYAATWAFSLHKQNRTREALEVLERLSPAQLELPAIAAYYGILLAAVGDTNAGAYLQKANDARLLPEELALVEGAKARR